MTSVPAQQPVTRREILVDGLETSYLEAGSGPPVVLLHGGEFGGESQVCWERTIPALAENHRVLAPDLLGFGRSAKVIDFIDGRMRRLRHFARFLEVVDAVGAPCIGNSMGGMLLLYNSGLETPLFFPSRVVTISGGGALLMDSPHTKALFDFDGSSEAMRAIVTALFHDDAWAQDDDYVRRRLETSLAPGAWEAISAARFRRPEHLQQARPPSGIDYARIAVPTLVVAGEDDKIKPHGWWDELTGLIPDCELALIPEAGHCSQIERPELVNPILSRFLA